LRGPRRGNSQDTPKIESIPESFLTDIVSDLSGEISI
jgi:hypothetical protein